MSTEMDEFQNLLPQQPETDYQQSMTQLEALSTQDFQNIMQDYDKLNLQFQRVIIDQPIIINKTFHINGMGRGTLRFINNGCLIFLQEEQTIELNDQEQFDINQITGCVIECDSIETIVQVKTGGLVIMDCQILNQSERQPTLIEFVHFFKMSSCIIQGFGQVCVFKGKTIDCEISETSVEGELLSGEGEGKILLQKVKVKRGGANFKGGELQIKIEDCKFKNSAYGLHLSECYGTTLLLRRCVIKHMHKFGIKMEKQSKNKICISYVGMICRLKTIEQQTVKSVFNYWKFNVGRTTLLSQFNQKITFGGEGVLGTSFLRLPNYGKCYWGRSLVKYTMLLGGINQSIYYYSSKLFNKQQSNSRSFRSFQLILKSYLFINIQLHFQIQQQYTQFSAYGRVNVKIKIINRNILLSF